MPVNKNWLVSQLGMVASPSWVVSYPDFTDAQYTDAPVGSEVVYTNVAADGTYGTHIHFYKVSNTQTTSDWWGKGHMYETYGVADCVDSTTTGTFTFTQDLPANHIVWRVQHRNVTGWTGDTSASAQTGYVGDLDAYNASSDPDFFSSVAALDGGAPQATPAISTSAVSPVVTVTSASDFTSVVTAAAGEATTYIYFEVHA